MAADRQIDETIRRALDEDVGPGDVTTTAAVPATARASAQAVAKQDLIVAGADVAARVFTLVDDSLRVAIKIPDGSSGTRGDVILSVTGPARSILIAERVALNFLMHLSGVATLTRAFVDAVAGTAARIIDTRKTTPGLRGLEKRAIRAGGGHNHRYALYDGVLIKDNHIRAVGSISTAVRAVKAGVHHLLKVEVEVTGLDELDEAVAAGADAVLLDNMTLPDMAEAAKRYGDRIVLEASGNVSLATVRQIAETGVHLISVGALTHSAPAADVSLRFLD
ncbi:MAG: carboxylating nicotinate-nucleotide diphosphorylase [Proteobacteria bacterium]|nr:carboxylating nicotinate-nucleotide diphosphorylase [Pseudomonadota bacterium]MBU1740051.1 carboxylating nicotinate-nucleotide diphosphorylase [Pseudomonadota bacterium]